jgi:hypothetical protein
VASIPTNRKVVTTRSVEPIPAWKRAFVRRPRRNDTNEATNTVVSQQNSQGLSKSWACFWAMRARPGCGKYNCHHRTWALDDSYFTSGGRRPRPNFQEPLAVRSCPKFRPSRARERLIDARAYAASADRRLTPASSGESDGQVTFIIRPSSVTHSRDAHIWEQTCRRLRNRYSKPRNHRYRRRLELFILRAKPLSTRIAEDVDGEAAETVAEKP